MQRFSEILEPFCNGAKTEVALINAVQVYCYEDTRIIKAFPQILKVSFFRGMSAWLQSSRAHALHQSGFVQQGLYLRPGYYLLAPEGLQAAGPAALFKER